MVELKGSEHPYSLGDESFVGFLVRPQGEGPHAAVLVFHEAPGLGEHVKMRAQMLAAQGYVALAADMHGGGQLLQGPAIGEALGALRANPDLLRARAQAALDALRALPDVDVGKVGAIGFCFGGMSVLELARGGADLKAVVSFHGLLETARPATAGTVRAAILACTGSEDPMVPIDHVTAFQAEMTAAGADWQVVTFGGAKHGFTNRQAGAVGNPALAWHPQADRRSWTFAMSFLHDALNGEKEA